MKSILTGKVGDDIHFNRLQGPRIDQLLHTSEFDLPTVDTAKVRLNQVTVVATVVGS
jgi:hypothetical protein